MLNAAFNREDTVLALIESSPAPRHGSEWLPRLASLAAHTALIAAAITATQHVTAVSPPAIFEVPTAWHPPSSPTAPAAPSTPGAPMPAPGWTVVAAPPVAIPPDIPPPGPGEVLPGPGGDPLPGPVLVIAPGGLPSSSGLPLDVRYVEEPPTMLAHPALRYPEVLRQAGIEGRVLVEAVLDTLGRAEPGSLRVTDSPHPLFDREALTVVAASRYRPGRVAGHAVRVRIQVPVTFTIRR